MTLTEKSGYLAWCVLVALSRRHRKTYFSPDGCTGQPFGQQPTINPLTARLTGNVAGVMKVFNRCGWQAEPDSGTSLPHQYSLMAGQGAPGKGD